MACLIPNKSRGTWQIQWHDGVKTRRVTIIPKRPGWKKQDGLPKRPPPEAAQALIDYQRREDAIRFNRSPVPASGVRDFLDGYLLTYEVGHRPGSVWQLRFAADLFLGFCDRHKVEKLSAVTPEFIDRYMTARARGEIGKSGRKIARRTLLKESGLLAAAWSRAVKLRKLTDNPWRSLEIAGKTVRAKKSSWSPEEYARLAASARPWLKLLLAVGVHTGIRVSGLIRMTWNDVEFHPYQSSRFGRFIVRPENDKAGVGYSVPMHEAAHDAIQRLAVQASGHDRVLRGQGGEPIGYVQSVEAAILTACKRAGLPKPESPCHAMRRTFGRWAVLGHLTGRPVPVYVVSRWLGHASVKMTLEYLDIREDESQDWMSPPSAES